MMSLLRENSLKSSDLEPEELCPWKKRNQNKYDRSVQDRNNMIIPYLEKKLVELDQSENQIQPQLELLSPQEEKDAIKISNCPKRLQENKGLLEILENHEKIQEVPEDFEDSDFQNNTDQDDQQDEIMLKQVTGSGAFSIVHVAYHDDLFYKKISRSEQQRIKRISSKQWFYHRNDPNFQSCKELKLSESPMVKSISSYDKDQSEEDESITDLNVTSNMFRIDNYNNSGTHQIKLQEQVPKAVIHVAQPVYLRKVSNSFSILDQELICQKISSSSLSEEEYKNYSPKDGFSEDDNIFEDDDSEMSLNKGEEEKFNYSQSDDMELEEY